MGRRKKHDAAAVPRSGTPEAPAEGRGIRIGFAASLAAVVTASYYPALSGTFVWNDLEYVTAPALRSLDGLRRIWFELGATEQYYPLLHSAFWVEHLLWGDAPVGYHLVNVFWHVIGACLFASLLRRLEVPGAWLAAFLFAVHPVCVESVAWISEQKNTLSLVFFLAGALAYLRFDERRDARSYALAAALFVCALLAKTTTAVLPAVLLVVFWWRRGVLEWRRDWLPLLPWLALAAGYGLFTAWVEREYIGAEGEDFSLGFTERGLLAGRVVWFYLGKLLWPFGFVFIYPRWEIDPASVWQWVPPVALVAVVVSAWAVRGSSRAPLAVVLLFAGSLFPVMGFLNVYAFIYSYVADHWQYLPSLAVFAALGAGLAKATALVPPLIRQSLAGALVCFLGYQTWGESAKFSSAETLYRDTIARNPECWMAYNNLGSLLRERGDLDETAIHYRQAAELRPGSSKSFHNLAVVLREQGRLEEAISEGRRAVELDPKSAIAQDHLGVMLRESGNSVDALGHHDRAVELDPTGADARNNRGMALREIGRMAEALDEFAQAVRLNPSMPAARLNLALTLSMLGRNDEAMAHYREARRLDPRLPDLESRLSADR